MLKSKFIANILELLLDRDVEGINTKPQVKYLIESDYEYTSSGVFIRFKHKSGIEKYKADQSDLILDGVGIKSTELEIGADCTLFFTNGLIDTLEIWSLNGKYPNQELNNYVLTQEWKIQPKGK